MALKNKFIIFTIIIVFVFFTHSAEAKVLSLAQGQVLLLPETYGEDARAYFAGVKMPVFNYNNNSYVLVAADVNKKPGSYNLQIKSGDKNLAKIAIKLIPGSFKKTKTGTLYKFLTLPKGEQEQVTADKNSFLTFLNQAILNPSPQLWQSLFRDPLADNTITSPFGYKRIYLNNTTTHKGVDLRAKIGTPIYAISDGKVIWGDNKDLYLEGPMVAIDHGEGIVSQYMHMSKVLVQQGQNVKAGDLIGYSGAEGADVTGPHLHLAIKVGNAAVDPLQFIDAFQKLTYPHS